jgi:hypothetical protein
MSLSHAQSQTSITTQDIFNQLLEDAKSINNKAKNHHFSSLEKELHQVFAAAERECMKKLLMQYDWDYPTFRSGEKIYRKASRNNKRYMTLAGEVELERTLYRTSRNSQTHCPLELNTGLVEGFWTPQAAKQAIHLVSLLTPVECENVFKEFGLMSPSKSSIDRLPKNLSKHWDDNRLSLERKLLNQYEIPEVAAFFAVSLDGVMLSTRYAQVLPFDSRWAEACCGTVSYFDAQGELLNTQYLARMPERHKRTLKEQLSMHFDIIREQRPDLEVVKIADGARDNWTFLDGELPSGECVLDFYHASQHLNDAFQAIHGKDTAEAFVNFKKYRSILLDKENGIQKVLNHLKYQKRKGVSHKRLQTEITYFTRHRERCHYAKLRAENKPIGSGIVEAACKTVVQMRLKRSGQHWNDDGGQAILTFRALLLSKQLDDAWKEIEKFYYAPIDAPDNVVKMTIN